MFSSKKAEIPLAMSIVWCCGTVVRDVSIIPLDKEPQVPLLDPFVPFVTP